MGGRCMDFITQLFNNMNLMGGGIALLVSIPFLIVGLVFLFIVVRAGGKVRASKNWPSTSGRVLASDIEMRRSRTGQGGTSTAYYPVVLYEYMVNGRRLQSNRVRFGSDVGFGWTSPAQKVVDQYPPGAMVEVFYNPNDPTEAVLQRTARTANLMFVFIAIVIIGSVLCTLVMTFGAFGFAEQFINGLGLGDLLGGTTKK